MIDDGLMYFLGKSMIFGPTMYRTALLGTGTVKGWEKIARFSCGGPYAGGVDCFRLIAKNCGCSNRRFSSCLDNSVTVPIHFAYYYTTI